MSSPIFGKIFVSNVEIINTSRKLPGPLRARFCDRFACQLRGLTFRRSLAADEGLLLVQARESRLDAAIHMLFMYLDITVVWLDASKQVVDVQLARRWRPYYAPQAPAQYILETGTSWYDNFNVGDQIEFKEQPVD
jgi:uncharacterized membrane protein (UPF0127 family)